jgi:hypothetical protein
MTQKHSVSTRIRLLGATAVSLAIAASCGHPSSNANAQQAAQAVVDWSRNFVSGSGDSCANLTEDGQHQLQLAAGATSCEDAAAKLLSIFTDQDKAGFAHASVDKSKIRITNGDHAQVPAGDVTYTPTPDAFLRLDGPLTLTKISGKWLLDSVVFVGEH